MRGLSVLALALFTLVGLSSCGPRPLPLDPAALGPLPATWEGVFAATPVSEARPIRSGKLKVPLGKILDLKSPAAAGMKDKEVWIGVDSVALKPASGGIVLLDAGLSQAYATRNLGCLKGPLSALFGLRGSQEPGASVAQALGPELASVKAILFTHLHFDHISGTRDLRASRGFPLAKTISLVPEIFAGAGEGMMNLPLLYEDDSLSHFPTIRSIPTKARERGDTPALPFFGQAADVLGDGSVWALPTPGHTKGGLSFLFKDERGIALYVGDAAMQMGLEKGIGPGGYSANVSQARKTMESIRAFQTAYPAVRILFAHEILADE
jgi:glyoxylase-like metal-dependent hydrolase (beta-lactamase superfamily II)